MDIALSRRRTLAGLLGLMLCPWSAAGAPLAGRMVISGSSTMAPLVGEIAKRFQTRHRGLEIEVRTGGSGNGIHDVRKGTADIGMVSRHLDEAEQDLQAYPIARDGVALIVHRDNPVRALSNRQITDILAGRVTNWKQVGGRDAPILVFIGEEGRGSSDLLARYFHIEYAQIKAHRRMGDNSERIRAVLEHPEAIASLSVGEAERSVLAGVTIKSLPVDGIAATSANIRRGDYPLARPLALLTRSLPTGIAKAFIEFALSSQATDLILAQDFVPYLD